MERKVPARKPDLRKGSLVEAAAVYLGTPYRYGGENSNGMDCSGLVWRAARDLWKIEIPRVSRDQANLGSAVMPAELKLDDLVFFSVSGNRIDHVGIYGGSGRFLHASSSKGVSWASLDDRYWKPKFRQARRFRP